ncbi:hypothetical protein [Limisalsivibrio acetivorans]|uniref:hypothetical protein n=1 Tax=Limisalsivibrio acetivorans TaxID=1304888 RepID=UPI0003B5271C|nr:hypothetical protein [Limisalsivibrio acetivorans]
MATVSERFSILTNPYLIYFFSYIIALFALLLNHTNGVTPLHLIPLGAFFSALLVFPFLSIPIHAIYFFLEGINDLKH